MGRCCWTTKRAASRTETNRLTPDDVIKLELDIALDAGIVERGDFTNEYVDAVEKLIDLQTIRNAGLKVIVDPMYGVGQLTLGTVLTEARCRVTFIHERHNPLFGGRSPAPNPEALRLLTSTMRDGGYDIGLAMDGDADRIAIVDELGEYISDQRCSAAALLVPARSARRARRRGAQPGDHAICWTAWRIAWARNATRFRSASSTSFPAWWSTMRCWAANRPAG